MTTNQSVFTATAIAIALLVGALMPGSNLQNADRAGDTTKSQPPSISDQALFARNLAQVEQLNRLFPLQLAFPVFGTLHRTSDYSHPIPPMIYVASRNLRGRVRRNILLLLVTTRKPVRDSQQLQAPLAFDFELRDKNHHASRFIFQVLIFHTKSLCLSV